MSQLVWVRAVGVHDPDRPVAVALVTAESELRAVWRPDEALCGGGRRFDDPLVAAVRLARDDHFAATGWVKPGSTAGCGWRGVAGVVWGVGSRLGLGRGCLGSGRRVAVRRGSCLAGFGAGVSARCGGRVWSRSAGWGLLGLVRRRRGALGCG